MSMASNPKEPHVCGAAGYGAIGDICPACEAARAASPLPAEPPPNPFRMRWEAHKRLIESTDSADRLKVWLAEFLWRNMTPLPAKIDRWINASDGTVVAFYEEMMPIIDREVASLLLAATPSAAEPQKEIHMLRGTDVCPYCGRNTPHSHETRLEYALPNLLETLNSHDRLFQHLIRLYQDDKGVKGFNNYDYQSALRAAISDVKAAFKTEHHVELPESRRRLAEPQKEELDERTNHKLAAELRASTEAARARGLEAQLREFFESHQCGGCPECRKVKAALKTTP